MSRTSVRVLRARTATRLHCEAALRNRVAEIFLAEAARRKMSADELATILLATIAADNLFAAVLDT